MNGILWRTFLLTLLLAQSVSSASPGPLRYVLVITGNELLEGIYADSHTAFITKNLHPLGWKCVGSLSVGDEAKALEEALQFATNKAATVIVTGGLGPTPNDITRDTIAAFTGNPLVTDETVITAMVDRLNRPKSELTPNLLRQCRVPSTGLSFPNPNGTAVGLVFNSTHGRIIALPGPPSELRPMVSSSLIPHLTSIGGSSPGLSRTIRFAGLRQASIDNTISSSLKRPKGIRVSSDFRGSRVDFTFTTSGTTPSDENLLDAWIDKVTLLFPSQIYGYGKTTLEESVNIALNWRNETLVIADAGTKGSLSSGLLRGNKDTTIVRGVYSAQSERLISTLLGVAEPTYNSWHSSQEKVKGMAHAAAAHSGASWTIAIGPLLPSMKETYQAWIAIKGPDKVCFAQRQEFPAWDQYRPQSLATDALILLRQRMNNADGSPARKLNSE